MGPLSALPPASIGGGALYPPFPITCRFCLFLQLEINKYCIFAKRPPPISKKSGCNHKGSKFQGVAPQYFVFFHYWGGRPPGKSSSRVLCQYSQKNPVTTTKDRNFGVFLSVFCFFFNFVGSPLPYKSSSRAFLQRGTTILPWYKRRKKPPPLFQQFSVNQKSGSQIL